MTTEKDKSSQGASGHQPDNNGTSSRTVPESDLMAVKRASEAETAQLKQQIADLTSQMTSERAARTAAEARVKDAEELQTRMKEMESRVKAAEESTAALKLSALQARRAALIQSFGVDAERVKLMDDAQLAALEAVLPGVKKAGPSPAALDASNGAGGGSTVLSRPRDMIAAGLAATK